MGVLKNSSIVLYGLISAVLFALPGAAIHAQFHGSCDSTEYDDAPRKVYIQINEDECETTLASSDCKLDDFRLQYRYVYTDKAECKGTTERISQVIDPDYLCTQYESETNYIYRWVKPEAGSCLGLVARTDCELDYQNSLHDTFYDTESACYLDINSLEDVRGVGLYSLRRVRAFVDFFLDPPTEANLGFGKVPYKGTILPYIINSLAGLIGLGIVWVIWHIMHAVIVGFKDAAYLKHKHKQFEKEKEARKRIKKKRFR